MQDMIYLHLFARVLSNELLKIIYAPSGDGRAMPVKLFLPQAAT
jgi:hypothetical protein